MEKLEVELKILYMGMLERRELDTFHNQALLVN